MLLPVPRLLLRLRPPRAARHDWANHPFIKATPAALISKSVEGTLLFIYLLITQVTARTDTERFYWAETAAARIRAIAKSDRPATGHWQRRRSNRSKAAPIA